MNVQIFLILLTLFAVITSLFTEAFKKVLNESGKKYSANIVASVAAALVGGVGTIVYYLIMGFPWTMINIICIPLMIIANWLGATVGYDKVKQTITQLKNLK
jgi:uncharacterized membrane protein